MLLRGNILSVISLAWCPFFHTVPRYLVHYTFEKKILAYYVKKKKIISLFGKRRFLFLLVPTVWFWLVRCAGTEQGQSEPMRSETNQQLWRLMTGTGWWQCLFWARSGNSRTGLTRIMSRYSTNVGFFLWQICFSCTFSSEIPVVCVCFNWLQLFIL